MAYTAAYHAANRDKINAAHRKARQDIKTQAFALFGSKCVHCGYEDIRALQLDHIYRATEPRNTYKRSGTGLYRMLLRGEVSRDDFQLLCANCNWIKKIENKEFFPVSAPQG